MAKKLSITERQIMEFKAESKRRGRETKILFQAEKKMQDERLKELSKPLFKKGPTTKSRGKKLKVSATKGAQGLFELI